jgi:glyoxalase-like protein/glyoxalase/bleomycin resistance protein/dioxygenase superfamily protein
VTPNVDPGIRRLAGVALAVHDLGAATASFERLGLVLSERSKRPEWGLDTATFGFANGSYLELVTPVDAANPVGGTVQAYLDRHGDGVYIASFEVDDVYATERTLTAADVPLAGPAQPAPESAGLAADMLWVKPRATGGGFTQFLSFRGGERSFPITTPDIRLFTQVYAVRDMPALNRVFGVLGHQPWAQYCTTRWGLDTTVFRFGDGSNAEIVSPLDASRDVAGVVAAAIRDRGQGHYMTVFEVTDVDAMAVRLEAAGVRTLGAPSPAPAESPWGPCQQLWIHPGTTQGAFVEFLTLPAAPAGASGEPASAGPGRG